MLYFDHDAVPKPKFFEGEEVRKEIGKLIGFMGRSTVERAQTDAPLESINPLELNNFSDDLINNKEVFAALTNITNDRCAFCEGRKSHLSPYRFRPLFGAKPSGKNNQPHEYYQWFKWEWKNIFLICSDCHPGDLVHFFPVKGMRERPNNTDRMLWEMSFHDDVTNQMPLHIYDRLINYETPILLEPGKIRNYAQSFGIDNGRLIGKTSRAVDTIKHFNLNAENTVLARRKIIQEKLIEVDAFSERADLNFKHIEYGGAIYLTLRSIVARMLKASPVIGRAHINDIQRTIGKLYDDPIWERFNEFASNRSEETQFLYEEEAEVLSTRAHRLTEEKRAAELKRVAYKRHDAE